MTTDTITEYDNTTADIAVGTRLYNEATVIAFRKVQDYKPAHPSQWGGASFSTWEVVAVREGQNFHAYASWTVIANDRGWYIGYGHYFHDIQEALAHIGIGVEQ